MKISLSNFSILIVLLTCLFIIFNVQNFNKFNRVIEYDVHTYYGYLPALFIYDDIKVEKSDYLFDENYHLFWLAWDRDGTRIMKMTMGTAFFYAPFFFVAHLFAHITDYPANGFSEPYKLLLLMSSVFFLFLGLLILRKVLQKLNFSDLIIAITILLLGLGTNLLAYSSQSAPLSHVYSFFLFAAFVFLTIQWYGKPVFRNSVLLGLTFGLISLVRPTNSVIVVFFLLYGITNSDAITSRIRFFLGNKLQILIIILLTFIVWIPQFLYWKVATGNFIYYSYADEGFNFLKPKILDGLFSFRKGWLIYTPIMIFSLVGVFFLKDQLKKFIIPISVFFLLNIYVIFSWWCWWYGGSFGQRTLVESYAILAIPFATFINYINSRKLLYQIPFYLVAVFFIWLNIFQTYQFEQHSLHWDGMSRKLYFKQFGKMDKIPDFDNYVHWIDYEKEKKGSKKLFDTVKDEKIFNFFTGTMENNRKSVKIRTINDLYWLVDENKNVVVGGEKKVAEELIIVYFDNSICAIKAGNNLFLSAELNNEKEITATRTKPDYWESFTIIKVDKGYVALKAANEKYVTVSEDGKLYARAEEIGEKEKFKLVQKKLFFFPDFNF